MHHLRTLRETAQIICAINRGWKLPELDPQLAEEVGEWYVVSIGGTQQIHRLGSSDDSPVVIIYQAGRDIDD